MILIFAIFLITFSGIEGVLACVMHCRGVQSSEFRIRFSFVCGAAQERRHLGNLFRPRWEAGYGPLEGELIGLVDGGERG